MVYSMMMIFLKCIYLFLLTSVLATMCASVCVCVCVCEWGGSSMNVCTSVCMLVCKYVCALKCMCKCVFVCVYASVQVCVYGSVQLSVYVCARVLACTSASVFLYVFLSRKVFKMSTNDNIRRKKKKIGRVQRNDRNLQSWGWAKYDSFEILLFTAAFICPFDRCKSIEVQGHRNLCEQKNS